MVVNGVNRICTHLGDKPPGMSVREFPVGFIEMGGPTLTVSGASPVGWGSG